ncbi:unnamed protein product, partial [marine sediment metagenome]
IVLMLTLSGRATAAAARLELVRNGASDYCIVIANDTRPVVSNAAGVLQEHLQKVTGVTLPIETLGGGAELPAKAILVGEGPLVKKAGVDLSAEKLKYDGFVVRLAGDRLVLTGALERGPLYAVIDFLEREVGCRWFSKQRVIIPQKKDLSVRVASRREEPAFEIRMPWGIDMWFAASRVTYTAPQWGKNPFRSDGNAHTFFMDAPAAVHFKDHPNWYSYHNNGVWFHKTGQLNYHNPDLIKHVRCKKLDAFK